MDCKLRGDGTTDSIFKLFYLNATNVIRWPHSVVFQIGLTDWCYASAELYEA